MAKSNRVQWRWAKRFDPGKFLFPFSAHLRSAFTSWDQARRKEGVKVEANPS
jgi:hypothetical protein